MAALNGWLLGLLLVLLCPFQSPLSGAAGAQELGEAVGEEVRMEEAHLEEAVADKDGEGGEEVAGGEDDDDDAGEEEEGEEEEVEAAEEEEEEEVEDRKSVV